ncbi:zinc finger protein 585A-like [Candoia aspera]|uniref:zinc finger protein 585A-like n=1 Tax=Candoia aspera TaxID=51853 RepID=UPI002FD813D1
MCAGQLRRHPSELLSRLDRGEEAWVPELQSSDESADEGPVKPTLKQLPVGGAWWDRYRSPVMYPSSDSANSGDEQESEEEKPHRGGYRPTILRRNLFNSSKGSGLQSLKPREAYKNGSQLKKPSRSQLGKTKAEIGKANENTTAGSEYQVSCPDCGQIFKSKLSLANHQRIHSKMKAYKCPYCRERFSSKKLLDRHQRGHAAEAGKSYSSTVKHQNAKLFECSACKKCFKFKEHLLLHQKSHTTQQPHECPERRKTFAWKELLVKHQNSHTTPKNNRLKAKKEEKIESLPETAKKKDRKAPVSKGTRPLNIGLTRQQQDQVNLHKCQFCGKCLRFKSLLVDHERMHREARPYKCSQCGKSFLRKPALRSHMMTHVRQATSRHPKKVKSLAVKSALADPGIFPTRGNSSKCPVSRKIITRSFSRTQCPRNQTPRTPCLCQYCGKSLSTSSILAEHEKLHTGERPYGCHKCAESFIRKHHLIRHQEGHQTGKLIKHNKSLRMKSHHTLPERTHHGQEACEGLLHASAVTRTSCLAKHPKIPTQENYVCLYCGKCTRTKSSFVNHGKIHRKKQQPHPHPECRENVSQGKHLASHQETPVGGKLSLCSGSENKMITKDAPLSLKHRVPHRRKLPYLCQKCGKAFDDNYSFTRHQRIHSGQKPFKCAACGKAFIQMWHLKRHERIHLKEKFPKQPVVMEANHENSHIGQRLFKCAGCGKGFFQLWHLKRHRIIHLNEEYRKQSTGMEVDPAFSSSGTASEEKGQGGPLRKALLQTPSHTAEVTALQHTQEVRRDPLMVLEEKSEAGAPEGSEQKEKPIMMQVQLSRKFKENTLLGYGEVRQAVQLEGKRRRKDIFSIHQPRNCSKNVNSQSPKEKKQAGWQLRPRASSRRTSKREMQATGKRAKRCFCQQEEGEMVPRKKSKPSRKGKYCAGPQSNPCASVSSSLFRGASKNQKPKALCLELPRQKSFSREAQMKVPESVVRGNAAFVAQERGSAGANSTSQSCEKEKCKPSNVRDPAEAWSRPQVPESKTQQHCDRFCTLNECPNATAQNLGAASLAQQLEEILKPLGVQESVKDRSCVKLQRAVPRELQRTPSKAKTVADQQRLETTQTEHVCAQCKKSFRSRTTLLIHEKNHTGNRPFPCTQCEKGFFALPALNVHMRIHTGEKPFKCPECDFRCNVLGNLNRHKRIHSRERLHACVRCGKSFWLNHKLTTSLKFSGKKKAYACPSCERASGHVNLLKLNRKF